MNVTRPIIEHCVDVELEAARREHEDFHSLHEAYAVTLEETDEAEDEFRAMMRFMAELWANVRADNAQYAYETLSNVEKHAINLAAEAVQVAAMARKARRLGKGTEPRCKWPSDSMSINSEQNKTWFGKE